MILKISTIAFIALLANPTSSSKAIWDGFVASWSANTSTHFYPIPVTRHSAVKERWTKISGVNAEEGVTTLGYCGDPTFVTLYDASGNIIGFQYAVPVGDVKGTGQPMKYDELGAISQKTLNGVSFYTSTVYFSHDESRDLRRIWIEDDKGFMEIPMKVSELILKTPFTKKRCLDAMGWHYYPTNPNTDCALWPPIFFVSDGENIIGVGFQTLGPAITIGNRVWWENIPTDGALYIVLDPPACLGPNLNKWGIYSLHVWWKARPQDLKCSQLLDTS